MPRAAAEVPSRMELAILFEFWNKSCGRKSGPKSRTRNLLRICTAQSPSFKGGSKMNSVQLEAKWKQVRGEVREKWGKLTDDDISVIGGRRDQLVGRVQERYGIAKEETTKQVDAFVNG
jgi:uncharacterized protein YjbJ (UPF0337 family)